MFESVLPEPALPARSAMPVLASVIRLLVSVTSAVGVNVAVQVMPPSIEPTAPSVPLAMVKSVLSKPVTASENVNVTRVDSPTVRELSATTMPTVGRVVSIA